jgi:NADH-quinone oxidoreductase subunit N
MNLETILLLRQELLLTLIVLVILIAELSTVRKTGIISLSIILMAVVTACGFIPMGKGILFGGMFHTDPFINLLKNILNIGVLIIFIQSAQWLRKEENQDRISEYYLLLISTLIGMNFMISSGNFLMFYLGLELATIPIAALAAFDRLKNKSAEAGVKLIMSSAFSSGILLYGISMIYGTTGSVYFSDVAATFSNAPLQVLAFIFFFAGMAFKISLVPFHLWTADVYEGAPVNVSSYLSVISKGAAVFIFTIVLYTVFKSISFLWKDVLVAISLITITVGNLFALRQQNLKRFLAFSSIAQAGFILLGIIDGTSLGMTATVYFIAIYIFSNLGAFGVVSAISNITGKESMDEYNGLYLTNPKLTMVMMLSLFSLAGIPPLSGFFGKFFLFTAAAHQGYYLLVLLAVLNSTISLYYYLLVIKAMFINKNDNPIGYFKNDYLTRLGLLICVIGIFTIGFASPIYDFIMSLAKI